MLKSIYRINLISRILFLLMTPTLFRAFNFAFIWHSIYWGVLTWVVMIWAGFIVVTPLLGRIGCGWFCFMGTVQDIVGEKSLIKRKWKEPKIWLRILFVVLFFASALYFYAVNMNSGKVIGYRYQPGILHMDFNDHYKRIWLYDTIGAVVLGLLLERRQTCKSGCPIGSLCAVGASYSRVIPVVDKKKCNSCKRCEGVCPVRIPITTYIDAKCGLVTNSECLVCGKCVDECKSNAITLNFVWSRKRHMREHNNDSPNAAVENVGDCGS